MPRRPRLVIPHLTYHITQRGNYRQKVFDSDKDYKRYSEWINNYARDYGLDIPAYCLMSNHVHFIAIAQNENAMARTFNTVHMRYAQYLNRKRRKGRCLLSPGNAI